MTSVPLPRDSIEPAATPIPIPVAGARQGIVILAAWVVYSLFKVALLGATQVPGKGSILYSGAVVMSMGVFWALVTPLVFALSRWLRARRFSRLRLFGIHVIVGLALAALVTVVRQTVMWLPYRQGSFGYWMGFLQLVDYHMVTYVMLVVVADALDGHRAYATISLHAMSLQTRLAEARLRFLQRQLQPHFLFNALNTIAELARESPAAARRTLWDLARLLRAAVAHADDPEVSLREELATLEPFVQIQRVRFSDSLDIRFNVAPLALDGCVPPLILQPLVENAVRHGRAATSTMQRVLVSAHVEGERLIVRVADSGAPGERRALPIISDKRGRGIGLRNTVERLTQLYGTDFRFELRGDGGQHTVAELDIPFHHATRIKPSGTPDDRTGFSAQGTLTSGRNGPEFRAPITSDPAGLPPATPLSAPLPSVAVAPPAPLTARGWGWMVLFWAGSAAYWMAQSWLAVGLRKGYDHSFLDGRIEIVSALVWVGITPVVLWLARTVPLHRGRLAPAALIHAFAASLLSALHIAIIFSIGVDDRPLVTAWNVNIFTLNLYIYCALLAWTHARAFSAWYHARAVAAAHTEAMIARARVESTALSLHAPFLLRVFAFTADLAMVDAERTERVVERLADLLRAMLETASEGARSVREELLLLRHCLAVHESLTGTPAELIDQVDARSLDAYTPPGAVNAVMEYILVRALAAPDQPLRIDARTDWSRSELVLGIEDSAATALAYDGIYLSPRSA